MLVLREPSKYVSLPYFMAIDANHHNSNHAHTEKGRSAYQVFLDNQPLSSCVAHTCVSYHRDDEPTLVWTEGESVLSHYA